MKQASPSSTRGAAPRLHAIPAVAERLDVSTKTVRRLIASGELISHRIGRSLRVSEDDLLMYLKKHRG